MTEVAGGFNAFYAQEKIVGLDDPHSSYKLALTRSVRIVLENGLDVIGIEVSEYEYM